MAFFAIPGSELLSSARLQWPRSRQSFDASLLLRFNCFALFLFFLFLLLLSPSLSFSFPPSFFISRLGNISRPYFEAVSSSFFLATSGEIFD